MEYPWFIDVEASSLSDRSYPIEIGIGFPDGRSEAMLISPAGVPEWSDWSIGASKLHGISRQELLSSGHSLRDVADWLRQTLGTSSVVSDNPDFDSHWLDELFRVVFAERPFAVVSFEEALESVRGIPVTPAELSIWRDDLARQWGAPLHRAAADVAWLQRLWELAVSQQAACS